MHCTANVTFLTNMHCIHHFRHSNTTVLSVASFQAVAMEQVSSSIGNFTVDLFNKLNETSRDKNIFFSPWSISSALTLTYLAAKGNTAREMAKVGSSLKLWCSTLPSNCYWDALFHCHREKLHLGLHKCTAIAECNGCGREFSLVMRRQKYCDDAYRGKQQYSLLLYGIYMYYSSSVPPVRSEDSTVSHHTEPNKTTILSLLGFRSRKFFHANFLPLETLFAGSSFHQRCGSWKLFCGQTLSGETKKKKNGIC